MKVKRMSVCNVSWCSGILFVFMCVFNLKGKQTVGTSLMCVGGAGKGKFIVKP